MLVVAYSYGIRSERKLCEEVDLHLAYRASERARHRRGKWPVRAQRAL